LVDLFEFYDDANFNLQMFRTCFTIMIFGDVAILYRGLEFLEL